MTESTWRDAPTGPDAPQRSQLAEANGSFGGAWHGAELAHQPVAAMIQVDRWGRLRRATASFRRWFARSPDEVEGISLADIVGRRAHDEILAAVARARHAPGTEESVTVTTPATAEWPSQRLHFRVSTWAGAAAQDGWWASVTHLDEGPHDADRLRTALQHRHFAEEASRSGSWQVDLTTGVSLWSEGMHRVCGIDAGATALTLDDYRARIHPEDRAPFDRAWSESIALRLPLTCRHRLLDAGTVVRHIELFGRARCDAQHRPRWMSGVALDVTHVRQLQDVLVNADHRWKFALERASQGVWDWELDSGRMTVSPDLLDLLGARPDELTEVASLIMARIHADDLPGARQAWQAHVDGHTRWYRVECRLRHQQGRWVWVELRGMVVAQDALGRPMRIVGTCADISTRKDTEAELRRTVTRQAFLVTLGDRLRTVADPDEVLWESARLLGQVLDASRVGHAEDLGDGVHGRVSRHFCNGLGSIEGTHRYDDFGSALMEHMRAGLPLVQADIESSASLSDQEKQAYRQLGVRANVHVPLLKHGALRAIVFVHWKAPREVSSDDLLLIEELARITWSDVERARALRALARQNEALHDAKEMAERASVAKSRFVSHISHEIRTPLNGVLGLTRMLRSTPLGAEQARMLGRVELSASHLLDLVNAVLDLSKIDAGKYELRAMPMRLEHVLSNAVAIAEPLAKEKGLVLRSTMNLTSDAFVGDAVVIQQALLNLLSNAIKFTAVGVILVDVSLEREEGATQMVRFTVRDPGVGIAPSAQPHLFAPFEQVDNTSTRTQGGTGLGLSITKQLAMLMGGQVGVQSELGRGSAFWFSARLMPDPTGSVTGEGPKAAVRTSSSFHDAAAGLRVLLAEDNEVNCEVAVALLQDMGAVVDVATDGPAALALGLQRDYGLILLDNQMPGMSGLQVMAELRATRRTLPPMVAMTADAFVEGRMHYLSAGADDVLSKPVMPDEMWDLIRRLQAPRAR